MEWFCWCFLETIQVQYWQHYGLEKLDGDEEEQQGNYKRVCS